MTTTGPIVSRPTRYQTFHKHEPNMNNIAKEEVLVDTDTMLDCHRTRTPTHRFRRWTFAVR